MRIILAHKFFHLVGGTEIYFQHLADILEKHGHETIPFSVQHPRNLPSEYDRFFLEPLDFRGQTSWYKARNLGRILARTLYSTEARRKIGALVRETGPDVAHLQAIENHISPSIVDELRQNGIPIVQSVNTYKHSCTSYRHYLQDKHEICERCRGGRHYHAVRTRCVKGSLLASTLGMLEMYLHHPLLRIYHKIDRFIVPNRFLEEKMVEAGYVRDKLVRLRNPFNLTSVQASTEPGGFILYFGRVEPEKGVVPLVQCMRQLPRDRLVVVGEGSDLEKCQQQAKDNGVDNIEFVGSKWGEELTPYLQNCSMVVVPSLWFEPSPYVIYQALGTGKPVVASRIGGIPDMITPDTGCLVKPGDVDGLAEAIGSINGDRNRQRRMGIAARAWAEKKLSPEHYYQRIMEVYEEICGRPQF